MYFGSSSKLQSMFSDSDSDDSVIPQKIQKQEISELKQLIKTLKTKNRNLKAENKSLKAKFEEVYSLNIAPQKKFLKPKENNVESSLLLPENNSFALSLPVSSSKRTFSPPISLLPTLIPESIANEVSDAWEALESSQEKYQELHDSSQEMENMKEVSLEIYSLHKRFFISVGLFTQYIRRHVKHA